MYTEFSHFLLFHIIFITNLWFIYLATNWVLWLTLYQRGDRVCELGTKFSKVKLHTEPQVTAQYSTFFQLADSNANDRIVEVPGKKTQLTLGTIIDPLTLRSKLLIQSKRENFIPGKSSSNHRTTNVQPSSNGRRLSIRYSEYMVTALILSIIYLILTSSFFGTISNYVCSDFSIYNILSNSTADVPLFYKISATWSNHEGSLLLWCWLLSLNTFIFCISISTTPFVRLSPQVVLLLFVAKSVSRHVSRATRQFYKSVSNSNLWQQLHFQQKSCWFKIVRCDKLLNTRPKYSQLPSGLCALQCSEVTRKLFGFGCFNTLSGNKRVQPNNSLWMNFFRSTKSLHFSQEKQHRLTTKAAFTAAFILIFFTTFCVFTSNPFLRANLTVPSINSLAELNPVLQDPVLAIHPPCIYAGYVASAIAFSLCISTFQKNFR